MADESQVKIATWVERMSPEEFQWQQERQAILDSFLAAAPKQFEAALSRQTL